MAPAKLLERNIRPQRIDADDDDDDIEEQSSQYDSQSESEENVEAVELDEDSQEEDSGDSVDEDDEMDEEDDAQIKSRMNSISFGALKQARDALSRKRKRGSDGEPQENKLEALRERLRQIREEKAHELSKRPKKNPIRQADTVTADASDSDSSSDSAPSETDTRTHARTSKHAPMEQTSKRQVTRRRQVVDIQKRQTRDPRFDPIRPGSEAAHAQHNPSSSKAYAFLRTYQESEIAELQSALKKAKTEEDCTILRRKLVSMQNTLKTADAKTREREVVRAHRKAERERVAQGKTPYYLKRNEIKERALVEKFKGMKGKEREKLMEKRRLKESQREKRRMPRERRGGAG